MSTGKEWLGKMKKGELSEMADHLKLADYAKAKKNELELMIEDFLNNNKSTLSKDALVAPFYGNLELASPEAEKKKPRRRQTIKAKETGLLSPETDLSTALTTTPSRIKALIPALPASPKDVANSIEASSNNIKASVSSTLDRISASLPTFLHPASIRASLSSPVSVTLLVVLLEAWGLRSQVLPLRYLSTIPAVPALGISWETPIKIPDLFALVTMAFWGPVSLWVLTSVVLPLGGAWFVNLQGGDGGNGSQYDLVSFSVTKALVAWVVYVLGGVEGESVAVVQNGVPGGAAGMLAGAGIGALAGLYDAVLKK